MEIITQTAWHELEYSVWDSMQSVDLSLKCITFSQMWTLSHDRFWNLVVLTTIRHCDDVVTEIWGYIASDFED